MFPPRINGGNQHLQRPEANGDSLFEFSSGGCARSLEFLQRLILTYYCEAFVTIQYKERTDLPGITSYTAANVASPQRNNC